MGTQLNKENIAEGKSYKEAIYQIGNIVTHRFVRIYLIVDFIFNLTSWGKAQKKILDTIHRFTTKVIRERKELLADMDLTKIGEKSDTNDIFMKKRKKVAMLDLLISAEKDGLIDHAGIQEEVDTFMFEVRIIHFYSKSTYLFVTHLHKPIAYEFATTINYK